MPEDIPTDIRLTPSQGTEIDGTGDFSTVTDVEYIKQNIAIDIINTFGHGRGRALTPERIEDYRSEVRHSLEENEYVEGPFDIIVTDISDGTLSMYIETADHEMEIDV